MYLKTLLLATTLAICCANSDILAQDKGTTVLHRLGRSLLTVPGATVEDYASPSLPCIGEGYYSHTSDCTKFYRCINVFSNRDFLRLSFICHAGTIFSSEYNSCIPGTCAKGQAAVEAANKYGSPRCSSEGRFADPVNCGLFYDCVPSHNGGFVAHQKSCFGNAFHPTLKACVTPQMVEGCIPSSTRSLTVADPKLQQLCNNENQGFKCADCKSMVICVDGIPYTETCEYGSVCSIKKNFGGGVCFPGDPAECTCNKTEIFQRDFYDPSKFLFCGIEGTDPIMHSCSEGLVFNDEDRACGTEIKPCTSPGKFVVKDDCTRYFICFVTIGGWVQKELRCRNNTMFNEETGKCEDPCDWYSGNFTCEAEGRFANSADCTKYYACFADPLNSDKFSLVEYECPEGLVWRQMMNSNVGHCVSTGTTKCKCNIPNDWCTPAVCSPNCTNGECTGPNICKCDQGWTGNLCETPVCSPSCINGQCIDHNICNCSQGWTGNLCQTPVCIPTCHNGECTDPNVCNCSQGWTGNHCQTPVCSPNCMNGECTDPNICNCSQGWTGNHCQDPICTPSCIYGECTGPNICKCYPGWSGNLCQTPVCSPNCTNGECIFPNICNCTQEWTGNLCQTPVCSPSCISGVCIAPNICNCEQGWTGNLCQSAVCNRSCINGECIYPDICSCNQGWIGNLCQTKTAYEVCPTEEGFFLSEDSKQCFKLIDTTTRTWDDANSKCQSEGLFMAEPTDSVAAHLREYVSLMPGGNEAWVAARGDGNTYVWQRSGLVLMHDSPLWDQGPGSGNVGTDKCVELDSYVRDGPPYDSSSCTSSRKTLCELIVE